MQVKYVLIYEVVIRIAEFVTKENIFIVFCVLKCSLILLFRKSFYQTN